MGKQRWYNQEMKYYLVIKKGGAIDTCNNFMGCQGNNAGWKKPTLKGYLQDDIYNILAITKL